MDYYMDRHCFAFNWVRINSAGIINQEEGQDSTFDSSFVGFPFDCVHYLENYCLVDTDS